MRDNILQFPNIKNFSEDALTLLTFLVECGTKRDDAIALIRSFPNSFHNRHCSKDRLAQVDKEIIKFMQSSIIQKRVR